MIDSSEGEGEGGGYVHMSVKLFVQLTLLGASILSAISCSTPPSTQLKTLYGTPYGDADTVPLASAPTSSTAASSPRPVAAQVVPVAISLSSVIQTVMAQHPDLLRAQKKVEAEDGLRRLKQSLSSPRIGWMRDSTLSAVSTSSSSASNSASSTSASMGNSVGVMNSWSVTQELELPWIYSMRGDVQRSSQDAALADLESLRWDLREQAIRVYVRLWRARRRLNWLHAQSDALREIARIAEARRATGQVPQQDEMKAHVEQTKNEAEYLLQKAELVELESQLNELLQRESGDSIGELEQRLELPVSTVSNASLRMEFTKLLSDAPSLRSAQAREQQAEKTFRLARWGWAPTFMLSYRQTFSGAEMSGSTSNSNNVKQPAFANSVIGIEATIPLWFWGRPIAEIDQSHAELQMAHAEFISSKKRLQSEVEGLIQRIIAEEKLVSLYEKALAPQVLTNLNSSRTAYSVGRIGFVELLDSLRSVYEVRMDHDQNLVQLYETWAKLEKALGKTLTNIPAPEQR